MWRKALKRYRSVQGLLSLQNNALKTDGPGPGSYSIPTTLDSSKGAVLLGRSSSAKWRYDSPGPGAYLVSSDNPTFKSKKGVILLGRPKDK